MKKQLHAYYSGRVQGVGFRFTAESVASGLRINGWVKNLYDGRVEIVAEAEEGLLKEFLQRLKEEFSRYIRDVQIDWKAAEGKLDGFSVEH